MATGAPPIKTLFSKFSIQTDARTAEQVIKWRYMYESKFAEALNTPLLGVGKLLFLPSDNQALFDILNVDKSEFKLAVRQSSIDNSFKVASDDFNLLVCWACHCFFNSSLNSKLKDQVMRSLFFMMLVKFFSSLMHHFFPHGAKQAIMEATIDSLSDKFDIKHEETSTWKLLMEARAAELVDPKNIHFTTLKTFIPDVKVVYMISDTQTRIRSKVRGVALVYYDFVKKGISIDESGLATTDQEGEKIIKELKNSFDAMIVSVSNRVLNIQQFINLDYIKVTSKLIANVRPEMIRTVLMQYSNLATMQYQKKKQDSLDKTGRYLEGYHILITKLIQSTYRKCIVEKVNLKSRLEILKKTMDIYRSSRIIDPNILQVKESVDRFVNSTKVSSREATLASLKIAFIVYIILLTFDLD